MPDLRKPSFRRVNALFALTVALMLAALLLGGASRLNELRLAFVELAALPLLVVVGIAMLDRPSLATSKTAVWLLAAVVAVPLIQLIPLPPGLWGKIPGREQSVLALELLNENPAWAPLSISPDLTWKNALALLPPVAMFLAVRYLDNRQRTHLLCIVLAFTALSILFGAAQIVGGIDDLYPWPTTNIGTFAGFFANRNHMATLVLIAIPFTVALGLARRSRRSSRPNAHVWLTLVAVTFLLLTLVIIRSRAGILLAAPVLGASAFFAWVRLTQRRLKWPVVTLVGICVASIVALMIAVALPFVGKFDRGAAPEGRFENWPVVAEAAATYLPLGSGIGSFDTVYRSVEPLSRLDPTFFNQAHNDYLELWLEAGWPGALLIILFLAWYARRAFAAWAQYSDHTDIERAATIAIAAVLVHSAGDYPLRTETIVTIFALCCALLDVPTAPESSGERRSRRSSEAPRPRDTSVTITS